MRYTVFWWILVQVERRYGVFVRRPGDANQKFFCILTTGNLSLFLIDQRSLYNCSDISADSLSKYKEYPRKSPGSHLTLRLTCLGVMCICFLLHPSRYKILKMRQSTRHLNSVRIWANSRFDKLRKRRLKPLIHPDWVDNTFPLY